MAHGMPVDDLFLRNIGTLTVEEQLKIASTRVGIAGCGLGSEVARQVVRFGFDLGALADPDTVEIHNLNRQHYHQKHVGWKKVHALLDSLRQSHPGLDPHLYEEGVTAANYKDFVDRCDIVVDGIDPDAIHLSIALTREAHRQGKPVVTALDIGFGARLFVFLPDGPDITEFMGLDRHVTDEELLAMPLAQLMGAYIQGAMPDYVMPTLQALAAGQLPYYPQNILAVTTAGSMITTACKRLALGQPVQGAPHYVHTDFDWLLAGNPPL